jgi:hypothetical protein
MTDTRRPWSVEVLIVVLLAVVFVPISLTRLIDGDEGTFLLVSRLTMEGQTLYRDVHYPQMPVLPHVYGLWMGLFGPSWYAGRVLSSIFAVLLGWLLFRHVADRTKHTVLGVVAASVLASSTLALEWYSTVKTLGLGTLLVFAGYAVLYEARLGNWRYLLSGVLLGFATGVRIYLITVAPLFGLVVLFGGRIWRERLIRLAGFAAGLVLALLPTEYYALVDAKLFAFNVIGHHTVRSDFGAVGWISQKLDVVLSLVGLRGGESVLGIQFGLLLLLNVAFAASSLRNRERPSLSLAVTVLLSLVSLVPTPAYTQYFSVVLPFMIVTACLMVARLRDDAAAAPEPLRRRLNLLMITTLVAYAGVVPLDVYRYTVDGSNVPGVYTSANAANWTIPMVRQVGETVDALMPAGHETVVSFWPGYLVETRSRVIHGLENHFAPFIARKMTVETARQHELMSYPELFWHLEQGTAPVVVLGNWANWFLPDGRAMYRAALTKGGYVLARRHQDTEIYTRSHGSR